MSEPDLPSEALAECLSQMKVFVAMIDRWPNFRKHIGYALLGGAIGAADMMGCDVEGFLVYLRKREPRPTPIEPGPRSAS